MTRTVADQFAETLAIAGVKRIYGIVGDSLNGLTDSLRRQGKIEWITYGMRKWLHSLLAPKRTSPARLQCALVAAVPVTCI